MNRRCCLNRSENYSSFPVVAVVVGEDDDDEGEEVRSAQQNGTAHFNQTDHLRRL